MNCEACGAPAAAGVLRCPFCKGFVSNELARRALRCECGEPNHPDAVQCAACGRPLGITCVFCKKISPRGQAKCVHCGESFEHAHMRQSVGQEMARQRKIAIIGTLAGLSIAAVVVGGIIYAAVPTDPCKSGDWKNCAAKAEDLVEGNGHDPQRGAVLYTAACDGGFAPACNNLAVQYNTGAGVGIDQTKALALYQQSCDLGNPMGCSNLGAMYDKGEGTKADPARALALFERACTASDGQGCTNAGILHEAGRGTKVDFQRAADFYQKACDLKYARSCDLLADFYEQGTGVPRSESRAKTLRKQACDQGYSAACR